MPRLSLQCDLAENATTEEGDYLLKLFKTMSDSSAPYSMLMRIADLVVTTVFLTHPPRLLSSRVLKLLCVQIERKKSSL